MSSIDKIILQYSTRNMDKIYAHFPKEYCKNASLKLKELEKGVVFLYTGFDVDGVCETDGPIGTYFLAKALEKLQFKPIIISDLCSKDFFKDLSVIYLNHKDCNIENFEALLNKYKPVCHISIERCGMNQEEKYTNARNEDISKSTPPIDRLFLIGAKTKPSFAIGDGGNEIGMGNFKDFIKNTLHLEPCIVKCDYPIIASVSNWGAYALISSLDKNLLPSFELVDEYLEYIVSLGAVDGISKKNEKSVDGKDWEIEKEILKQLKDF